MSKKLSNRELLEAIYNKVTKQSSNPFSGPSPQVDPAKPVSLPAQWNRSPWEGAEIPPTAPKGHHWEFDYANKVIGLFKDCGPLGS